MRFDVDTYDGAERLNAHVAALPEQPVGPGQFTALIVGAGLTGIETATEMPGKLRSANIRDRRSPEPPRVIVADHQPRIGSDMGEGACRVIDEALASLGVESRTAVSVAAVDGTGATFSTGERIPAKTVVWCAGMRANPLTELFPVERDRFGRIPVDSRMKVEGMRDLFAAGDAACTVLDDLHPSVMSCQHARPMGRFAGYNVVCDLLGKPTLPLRIDWYTTILDLGPWGAVYTEGWDRRVATIGADAKLTKQLINCQRIYPPRSEGSPGNSRCRRPGGASPAAAVPRTAMPDESAGRRYTANLQGEVDGAALYRTLSQTEKNPELAQVYARLGAVEEAHAEFWKRKIEAIGQRLPKLAAELSDAGARLAGAPLRPGLRAADASTRSSSMDSGTYDTQPEAVAGGLPAAERSHARIIEALAAPSPGAFSGPTIARLEGRHRALGGNALRAAVLGANDGLCSNLSLVMGVAGAELAPHAILVTGLAGLLAGACSMALGEWLSVSTTRESYQRQIKTEADELEQVPEEEEEELALIYQAKGLPEEQAKALAQRLIANKETALDTLVREELGIDPEELGGSAWTAAGTSFLLFAVGAIFPVAPYFALAGLPAVIASLAASGVALFLIGAGTTLFTGLGVWFSGMRQLLVGFAAAGVTYGVGKLIGVAVTG